MNLAEQLKEAQGKIAALEANMETVSAERDEALKMAESLEADVEKANGNVEAATKERDEAIAKVAEREAKLKAATENMEAASKERDTLKAQLELSPGHKDLSAGTEKGGAGSVGAEGSTDDEFMKAYQAASPAEKRRMWKDRQKGGFMRFGAMLMIAAVCVAGIVGSLFVADASARDYDQVILEATNVATGTVATTVSDTVVGAVESITVIVPSGVTVDVAVASSYLTLFAKDDVTGTNTYFPRFAEHNTSGTATNTTDKAVIVDTVTASYDEASTTNQTIRTLINIRR